MMGKQSKPNIEFKRLLDESSSFYQDLLGYKPENTGLGIVSKNRWIEFTKSYGLNSNSSGIFLPRNQTAIIRGKNPLSLFHEYFGHGLYCEQNLTGRRLVELEKKLLEDEKLVFNNKKFNLEDLREFRKTDPTFQELEKHREKNIGNYELFAIWTEYLLSRENGMNSLFEKKYDSLTEENKCAVESVINFSKQYGDLATMYSQGMARRTTTERVKKLLGDVCRQKLDSIRLGILFGSKDKFSDIDIYLVSDEIEPFSSDWIDARVHNQKRFEEGLRNFDVRVTDPLFSGELIFGNRDYFEQQKQVLLDQLITDNAIKYNLQKSEDYRSLQKEYFELCEQVENPSSYSETYLVNALALREGKRLVTKENLISYSTRASVEGDKQPQVEGGTEKNAT